MKNIRDFSDIHSHDETVSDNKIINLDFNRSVPQHGYYSIGLHPWSTEAMSKEDIDKALENVYKEAESDNVVAIGECGVDKLRGAAIDLQIYAFEKQIEISEKLHKPLIIHAVKSFDTILQLHKSMNPQQLWIIHGFRSNSTVARQLLSKGIALSYGEFFNEESVKITPKNMKFSETDESKLDIDTIQKRLSINC